MIFVFDNLQEYLEEYVGNRTRRAMLYQVKRCIVGVKATRRSLDDELAEQEKEFKNKIKAEANSQ